MKKVLIVKGSPRRNGNTSRMADAFCQGAKESGNQVKVLSLIDTKISDCVACNACQNGNGCVQKDDMQEIYKDMMNADRIVFASPVYFYCWTSLMKRMIDRTYALEGALKNKDFYLLSAGAAPEEKYMQTMKDCFVQYVSCFENCTVKQMLIAYGTNKQDDVVNMPVIKEAYRIGKNV